jgi:hypothetical protein
MKQAVPPNVQKVAEMVLAGVKRLQSAKSSKNRKGEIMRKVLLYSLAITVWGAILAIGWAEETKAVKPAETAKVETKTMIANAALRAEIHRTIADLIEAQAAEKPDVAKVEALTKKIQDLRGKLFAAVAQPQGACPCCQTCCLGTGCGFACCGVGRGCGMGRGPGMGWGGGRGFGPGAGRGLGAGPAAVDADHDGVCDRYEARQRIHH